MSLGFISYPQTELLLKRLCRVRVTCFMLCSVRSPSHFRVFYSYSNYSLPCRLSLLWSTTYYILLLLLLLLQLPLYYYHYH